jgi:hypothetical protein
LHPALEVGKAGKSDVDAAAQGSDKNKKKKKKKKKAGAKDKPLTGAPTATAIVAGGSCAHTMTSTCVSHLIMMRAASGAWCTTPSVTAIRMRS